MLPLEMWVGPECTVNRIGDGWFDQLDATGFAHRLADIDRIASLGVRCMRLPLLWERAVTERAGPIDWRWSDARMQRLHACGMKGIAGLVHHGSGPRGTDLLDPGFATDVADYARAVAERYPDITAYTPVNEPMTTARFSGLYGVWFPHRQDDASFVRALLNQLRATVLAMRAIRKVNPAAQLVQTDDLGFTKATPSLQYQADFENERRWLGFDLLCGRVDSKHPLWHYLRRFGASQQELMAFVELPCPPDIVGINCYVTSQRFLDHRLASYPDCEQGGNKWHSYVDVESVRVYGGAIDGFETRLSEAWARYRRPVALTEVHLSCTREEQLRWLQQAWDAAHTVRSRGADVRAVTAWAAFGTVDWDTLVTQRNGRYEPGLWDVRSPTPRPTALARLVQQLAQGEAGGHLLASGTGWWQRPIRHRYPTFGQVRSLLPSGPPLLITGGGGTLGRAFAHACRMRGLPYRLLRRADLDVADAPAVHDALERWKPWAVVNTAGFARVDAAETAPQQWRENVRAVSVLAQACVGHAARLVTFSSDLVFDGAKSDPYVEGDATGPLNAYGRAKAKAETLVLQHDPTALMVRTAAFFGPWDQHNFLTVGLQALREGRRWRAAGDQIVSPTYVCDLVRCTLDLLVDGEHGIWHLANQGATSWADFAVMAASGCGMDSTCIDAVEGRELGQTALRPQRVVIDSERGRIMPTLQDAVSRYLHELTSVVPQQHDDAWAIDTHDDVRRVA